MKKKRLLVSLVIGIAISQFFAVSPAIASPNPNLWCWSMQSGAVQGTFSMTPATSGDGTAAAGLYTLTDFSLTSSTISGIYPGSISNDVYEFGGQAPYTIAWDGSQPTSWNRDNGFYTNGIGIYSGPSGFTTELIFHTNYQVIEDAFTSYVFATVTPELTPASAAGLCPGDVSPSPTPTSSTNADVSNAQSILAQTGENRLIPWAPIALVILGLGSIILGCLHWKGKSTIRTKLRK